MTREQLIGHLRVAGYHGDRAKFMRLYGGNRIEIGRAQEAFEAGRLMRATGMKCSCIECRSSDGSSATTQQPKLTR